MGVGDSFRRRDALRPGGSRLTFRGHVHKTRQADECCVRAPGIYCPKPHC
jgi:hypothetical protein